MSGRGVISFATPKSSPARLPPAGESGIRLWLGTNLFGNIHNTALTLLALCLGRPLYTRNRHRRQVGDLLLEVGSRALVPA